MQNHKNKTISSILATFTGSIGLHRFYLYGKNDPWAWLHFCSLPISFLISKLYFNLPFIASFAPWIISGLIGLFTALYLGLKSDEKWDQTFNSSSNKSSDTSWIIAVNLVFTLGLLAISFIGLLARTVDLLNTGGAYG
jgi:hypothetical protein